MTDETVKDGSDDRTDVPQPSEDPATGASGSTDERSSENRREGLEKEPDATLPDEE